LKAAFNPATGVAANRFVEVEQHRIALLLRNRHPHDLVAEPAGGGCIARLAMTVEGVVVLAFPADLVLGGDDLAGVAHVTLLERAPQAVVDHRVDHRAVAEPHPLARFRQQVRTVAHRLHPAGDYDARVAGGDGLCRQHHRLQP
jgi:hypothetical protein